MATIIQQIEEMSRRREELLQGETEGHGTDNAQRLERVDHRLRVLWDLRRRELAGEKVDPNDDFLDDYDKYGGRERSPSE